MAQGTTRGVPIDTDPLLAADSDLLVPSQKAIKTYVDTGLLTKQGALTLTTTGTSGASTLLGNTLNIPQYAGATPGGATGNVQFNSAGTFAGSNNLFWDNTNNRLGIGTASPTSLLHNVSTASSPSGSDSQDNMFIDRYVGSSGGTFSTVILRKARGSSTSPSAVQSSDGLGAFGFRGYGATGFSSGSRAFVGAIAAENWTDAAQGAYMTFNTTSNGTASGTERLRINNNGNILIGTTTDAGYKLDVNGTGRAVTSLQTPTLLGNTTSGGTLTLQSTSNATKGKMLFGTSAYDEVNNRLGIGTASPTEPLHIRTAGTGLNFRTNFTVENTNTSGAASMQFINGNGRNAFVQYTGSTYAIGEGLGIFTESDKPVNFFSNGANPSGGTSYIAFSPGGYANESVRFFGSKNVGFNTTTDAGYRLDVNGTARAVTSLQTPTLLGNTTSGGTLTLQSTSNATKGKLLFGTSAYDEVNNRLGIGTATPSSMLHNVSTASSPTTADAPENLILDRYVANNGVVAPTAILRKARGTSASPSAVQSGDVIGVFGFRGYDGTSFTTGSRAFLSCYSSQNWTSTANGTYFVMGTTANGTTSGTERLRIDNDGNVLIGTTTNSGYNLDVNGTARANQFQLSALNTAPATSTSTGTTGEIRIVNGFIYVCVATNTWQRATLSTF